MIGEYENVCVWPDYTTCLIEDLNEYLEFMSDDYVVMAIELDETMDLEEMAVKQYKSQYECHAAAQFNKGYGI